MKKFVLAFSVILLIFIMTGCVKNSFNIENDIIPPSNQKIPISGTWQIYSYKCLSNSQKPDVNLIGKNVVFSINTVSFLNQQCVNPQYKLKIVDTDDYFFYTYNTNYEDLGIKSKTVKIISIISKDKLFYDFVSYGDRLMTYLDGTFYYFKKTDAQSKGNTSLSKKKSSEGDDLYRSGILLGLKYGTDDKTNELNSQYKYKTLWISAKNRIPNETLMVQNLLVPRLNGFWTAGTERNVVNGKTYDEVFAYPVSSKISMLKKSYKSNTIAMYKSIIYVGSNYICLDSNDYYNNGNNDLNRLDVFPLENIMGKRLKITDIFGNDAKKVFLNSGVANNTMMSKAIDSPGDNEPELENFYVDRRNGHWFVIGRMYEDTNTNYKDFVVNIQPAKKLVNYDNLCISWNAVKEKIPQAVDVYTSPNKDIALVVTANYIYVYAIFDNYLSDRPIEKINIGYGNKIVMAEWATGPYEEIWAKNVMSQKAAIVK